MYCQVKLDSPMKGTKHIKK